jgi:P27 family predicted phage terminase small subunit
MALRGPIPLPTRRKELRGTLRKDRMNPDEPQPAITAPACPDFLDDAAQAEWARLAPQLLELRLLAETDRAMLAAHCVAWSRWERAERKVAEQGAVLTSSTGVQRRNPWTTIAKEARAELERTANHFGLSPATRGRVAAAPQTDEHDPFSRFDEWKRNRQR